MKIGCPNNPRANILKEIEWIGGNRFDFIDLFLEEDKASRTAIDIQKVKTLLDKYNLSATGHLAWYLPFGSPVKSLREAAVNEASAYLEVFRELGVTCVTVHANWAGGLFSAADGIVFQAESLQQLSHIAGKSAINLMYEPIDTHFDTLQNVSRILKLVPGLLFHLDIGHANLFNRSPSEFIKELHPRLSHVHLHDNMRNLDLHLPLGCGNINWKETIGTLKKYYDGTITLEIFSKDRDYLLLSREKLVKLWKAL